MTKLIKTLGPYSAVNHICNVEQTTYLNSEQYFASYLLGLENIFQGSQVVSKVWRQISIPVKDWVLNAVGWRGGVSDWLVGGILL